MTPSSPNPDLFLKHYVSERLPQLRPGTFEVLGDPPSFAVDQRYIPFHDPSYRV